MSPLVIFSLLLLCCLGEESTRAPTSPPPYCFANKGCALRSVCQCPATFTECVTTEDDDGKCQFTQLGIGILAVICIGSLALLILFLCCLFGCCCCCRKSPDNYYVTNYHPPVGSYDPHQSL